MRKRTLRVMPRLTLARRMRSLPASSVAVLEQVMGLQPAERPGPLPRAVRQDARHQTLAVVVENRLGNPAEEGKGRIRPKLAPFTDIIDGILEEDRTVHRKRFGGWRRRYPGGSECNSILATVLRSIPN